MTYEELKRELCLIRENRKRLENIKRELRDWDTRKFEGLVTVTDPTREYTGTSKAKDDTVINTLYNADNKKEWLSRKLEELPDTNEAVEDALIRVNGNPGTALWYFFIRGLDLWQVAREMERTELTVKKYLRDGIEEVWQAVQTL